MSSHSPSSLMKILADTHQHNFHWTLACCQHQEDEALDLLQEAYLLVLEGRVQYLGNSTVKTWFFGIIKNLAFQKGRLFKRRLKLLQNAFSSDHPTLAFTIGNRHQAVSYMSVDGQFENQERQSQIAQALKSLSTRQQQIMHLVFYQGCTLEECAQILKLSVGSTRTHYARAKKKLALALHDLNPSLIGTERGSIL